MKISKPHLGHIRAAISDVTEKHGEAALVAAYQSGNFPRADKVQDLQKRFCFDLYYAAPGLNRWVCENLYPIGLNDSHLFTALKAVCPIVERKY